MHVGRLLVDRRQRFRREIVDLDHFGDRFMRRRELFALGLGDDALLHGLLPVVKVGGAHSFGDILGAGDQQERLFQPRHAAVIVDMRQIRRQAIARRRRLQHQLRALMHHAVGRAEHARAERLDQEFQDDGDKAVGQIRQDFREAVFDGA